MNRQQIINTLTPAIRQNNAAIGETNRRLVKLGDGQGQPAPANPLDPREVFYRSEQDANDRGIALLGPHCGIPIQAIDSLYNVPVWIANVPGTSYPVIVDVADVRGQTTGSMHPMEALANAAAHPDLGRIVYFRLRPSLGGGISVFVDVGWEAVEYQDSSGNNQWFRSQDFGFPDPTDSTIYNPTAAALTSGQHRLIGIAFDPASGLLRAIPGAAATAANTLPSSDSRSEFVDADYAAIKFTDLIPGGFIYSYYGQTSLVEDDFMRHFEPRSLSSPAGGTSLIDRILTDHDGNPLADHDGNLLYDHGS